jgi:hypothetical protein
MTVQAISQGHAGQPLVSVCCVSGDERGGNPVTLPVTAANRIYSGGRAVWRLHYNPIHRGEDLIRPVRSVPHQAGAWCFALDCGVSMGRGQHQADSTVIRAQQERVIMTYLGLHGCSGADCSLIVHAPGDARSDRVSCSTRIRRTATNHRASQIGRSSPSSDGTSSHTCGNRESR